MGPRKQRCLSPTRNQARRPSRNGTGQQAGQLEGAEVGGGAGSRVQHSLPGTALPWARGPNEHGLQASPGGNRRAPYPELGQDKSEARVFHATNCHRLPTSSRHKILLQRGCRQNGRPAQHTGTGSQRAGLEDDETGCSREPLVATDSGTPSELSD